MDIQSEQGPTQSNQNRIDKITNLIDVGGKAASDKDPAKRVAEQDHTQDGGDTNENLGLDSSQTSVDERDRADPQPDAAPAEPDTDRPVSLKELAESLDLDAKDLYDVEIGVGADKMVKMGDLKDYYHEVIKFREEHAEFETRKTAHENETMVAKRQIEQLVELGVRTNSLHPEVITRLEDMHSETVTRERRAVLSVMPEWKDDVKRQADFDEIHDLTNQYGFSRVEVEAVLDHRLLKLLRDVSRRENQIKNAIPLAKALPKETGKSRRAVKTSKLQERIRAAKTGTRGEKLSVISELIQ